MTTESSDPKPCILYCHCAYTKIVPEDVKNGVLEKLAASEVAFEAVPDLCEMAASKDPALKRLAGTDGVKIAACYPRAVKWLFNAADAPLPDSATVLNMRTESVEEIMEDIFDPNPRQRDAEDDDADNSDAAPTDSSPTEKSE